MIIEEKEPRRDHCTEQVSPCSGQLFSPTRDESSLHDANTNEEEREERVAIFTTFSSASSCCCCCGFFLELGIDPMGHETDLCFLG